MGSDSRSSYSETVGTATVADAHAAPRLPAPNRLKRRKTQGAIVSRTTPPAELLGWKQVLDQALDKVCRLVDRLVRSTSPRYERRRKSVKVTHRPDGTEEIETVDDGIVIGWD